MTTRILLIGFGSIAQRHLSIINKILPSSQILLLRATKLDYVPPNISFVTNDFDHALGFQPNISLICSPAPTHLDFANHLLDYGSHIFLEKPISTNLDQAKTFLRRVEASRKVCHVGYNLRYLPSLLFTRASLHSGLIGDIYNVRAHCGQYLPTWRPGKDYRKSVSSLLSSGGGVVNELSHEIDYIQWMLGSPEWVSAYTSQLSHLDIDVEDYAAVTMSIPNTNTCRRTIINLTLDCFRHDTSRACIFIGSRGSLRWSFSNGLVELMKPGSSSWQTIHHSCPDVAITYTQQMNNFLHCIRESKFCSHSIRSAVFVLKTINAIKQSSHSDCSKVSLSIPPTLQ